jgi:hypothetical protein
MSEPFADAAPGIAFIYSDETFAAHVREAIDAKVHIVYQASAADLDAARLSATRAAAALVNLDGSSNGDKLEEVTAVLSAAGVPVVFNDAEISRGLDGWARARWARHLLAKLRGSRDFDPPRPDAERPGIDARGSDGDPIAVSPQAGTDSVATPLDEVLVADPAAASRPLSRQEIESLVADFPSAEPDADDGTIRLAAMIDERLAETDAASEVQATPWETAAQIGEAVIEAGPDQEPETESPQATPEDRAQDETTGEPAPEMPSADTWRLVEAHEPVASAPPDRAAATSAEPFTGSLSGLELMPLEDATPAKVKRASDGTEMRLESGKPDSAGQEPASRKGDAA